MEKPAVSLSGSALRSIGQEIDRVRVQFAETGALGMLVIDGVLSVSMLSPPEASEPRVSGALLRSAQGPGLPGGGSTTSIRSRACW